MGLLCCWLGRALRYRLVDGAAVACLVGPFLYLGRVCLSHNLANHLCIPRTYSPVCQVLHAESHCRAVMQTIGLAEAGQ